MKKLEMNQMEMMQGGGKCKWWKTLLYPTLTFGAGLLTGGIGFGVGAALTTAYVATCD